MSGIAKQRAQMPRGAHGILNARNLEDDHACIARLLRPGDFVLDVGCGGGAITEGMARAVGPSSQAAGGLAVGVDIGGRLLAQAGPRQAETPALGFAKADIYHLPFHACFDIVTAARTLQWLEKPYDALVQMVAATRPGGRVAVLDFNHEKASWAPEPPPSMAEFYRAFLRWRDEAGMDNAMADHLAEMFDRAGLVDIDLSVEDEVAERGAPNFQERAGIWAQVAASRGHQLVADGIVTESLRAAAESEYRAWVAEDCQRHTSYMRCVVGTKPA